MSTTRTDPHRVGAIIPTDYDHIISFGILPMPRDEQAASMFDRERLTPKYNVDQARKLWEVGPTFRLDHRPDGLFSCTVCGASYNHGDLWRHRPTGVLITMGHDCADKYSLFCNRAEWVAWHREQTRLRSLAAKEKKHRIKALKFLETRPQLRDAFDQAEAVGTAMGQLVDNPRARTLRERNDAYFSATVLDMRSKLNKYGSLSDAQVSFALKLANEARDRALAPAPVEEVHVPAPEGRQVVEGTVVSIKGYDGAWGHSYKMTVKVETPQGIWLCWGTLPRGVNDVERGSRVRFTATLERGRDAHFAFAKRPTGATVLS